MDSTIRQQGDAALSWRASKGMPPIQTSASVVVRAQELLALLDEPGVRLVDMRPKEHGIEGFIPGSVHLDYDRLVRRCGPVDGLIPEPEVIAKLLSELGIEPWHRVVVYDDESGLEASRLLWTLAVAGHEYYSLLDGGFEAWRSAGLSVSSTTVVREPTCYPIAAFNQQVVDKSYVLDALDNENSRIVDTRTMAEFNGEDLRAARGGRIPGAIHFNWADAIDLFGSSELLPLESLQQKFLDLNVTPDREVIVYCQSNRRCAHTFVVLKWLGYDNVKSYAGSWSEWGNSSDTPIEV